jgi:hypothetical protein
MSPGRPARGLIAFCTQCERSRTHVTVNLDCQVHRRGHARIVLVHGRGHPWGHDQLLDPSLSAKDSRKPEDIR